MNKHDKEIEAARLRRTAEQLAGWAMVHSLQAEADARKLLHELQVHQIELEMQNAELQRAHTQTEAALKKVTGLNESLKQTINELEAIQTSKESIKRALIVSVSNEILEPINVIKKMCAQLRHSDIDSKLADQLDRLELASRDILKSINSF